MIINLMIINIIKINIKKKYNELINEGMGPYFKKDPWQHKDQF